MTAITMNQAAANLIAEGKAMHAAVPTMLNKGDTPAAAARSALSTLTPVIKARAAADAALKVWLQPLKMRRRRGMNLKGQRVNLKGEVIAQ